MAYGYPGAMVTFWEDFLRDNVTNMVETAGGSATQDANITAPTHGGWWQQQMGGDDNDDLNLAGEVAWEVDEGSPVTFETRARPSSVSAQCAYAGMSDADTESSAVSAIDSDAGTLTATATDGVYFLLDESAGGTLDTIWSGVGISNGNLRTGAGVLGTQANAALVGSTAVVAATPQTLRMVLTPADLGTARFYIGGANDFGGGVLYGTYTNAFRSSIALCPFLGTEDRAVNVDMDWDYIAVSAPRT